MSTIATGDILLKYSTKAGGVTAGNSATSNAAGSLGKYISTSVITSAALYNLFPTLTGDQNAASASDYKCFFVHNNHATLTLIAPVIWVSATTASSTDYSIGIDTTAASLVAASSAQALTIATTASAPAGVSFSAPATKSAGLAIGDLPAGYCRAVWVKRKANNTGALYRDVVTLSLDGDTGATA